MSFAKGSIVTRVSSPCPMLKSLWKNPPLGERNRQPINIHIIQWNSGIHIWPVSVRAFLLQNLTHCPIRGWKTFSVWRPQPPKSCPLLFTIEDWSFKGDFCWFLGKKNQLWVGDHFLGGDGPRTLFWETSIHDLETCQHRNIPHIFQRPTCTDWNSFISFPLKTSRKIEGAAVGQSIFAADCNSWAPAVFLVRNVTVQYDSITLAFHTAYRGEHLHFRYLNMWVIERLIPIWPDGSDSITPSLYI